MSFPGSTFGLFNDADCTSEFSGTLNIVGYTDLSDGSHDFTLYLGSLATDRVLEAASNPSIDDITITPTDTTPAWTASTAYSLGKLIKPTTPNGFVYKCITSGTSSSSEPTWPIVGIGSTIADGTALWALYANHHPTSEVKLALSSGGLFSATGGASLALGPTINSLAVNARAIYIRVTNSVTVVTNDTGNAEIGLLLNNIIELGSV